MLLELEAMLTGAFHALGVPFQRTDILQIREGAKIDEIFSKEQVKEDLDDSLDQLIGGEVSLTQFDATHGSLLFKITAYVGSYRLTYGVFSVNTSPQTRQELQIILNQHQYTEDIEIRYLLPNTTPQMNVAIALSGDYDSGISEISTERKDGYHVPFAEVAGYLANYDELVKEWHVLQDRPFDPETTGKAVIHAIHSLIHLQNFKKP